MTALKLSVLPLQFICQLIASGQTGINGNETLAIGQQATQGWPTILPDGYQEFPDVRSAYKLGTINATWAEARKICISEGGRLAIADTRQKIAHMMSLDGATRDWCFVGIHSLFDREWVRVDNGLPVNDIPWARLNPEGHGNCSALQTKEIGLFDYDCSISQSFICEIPNE